jgi:hypothetical protein
VTKSYFSSGEPTAAARVIALNHFKRMGFKVGKGKDKTGGVKNNVQAEFNATKKLSP